MRVEQFLSDSATRYAKRPAVVAGARQYSYADLARSSDRVAGALAARGIRRGDRVALFMDDNFEAVVSAFAVLKVGAVATPVEPTSDAAVLGRILAVSDAAAIVTESRLASVAAAAVATARNIRLVLLCGGDRATASGSCMVFEEVAGSIGPGLGIERAGPASDPAIALHVIGPDGIAEQAMLSHAEVIAAAATVSADRPASTRSSILSYYGVCQLLATVRAGATLVFAAPSALRRVASVEGNTGAVPVLAA